MKCYTIRTKSEEGSYYLVNGWRRHRTFWLEEKEAPEDEEMQQDWFFRKPSQARASLTKLLKVMPDYASDEFELVEFG